MGIGFTGTELYSILYNEGLLANVNSICELGDQEMYVTFADFQNLLPLFKFPPDKLERVRSLLQKPEGAHTNPNSPSTSWFLKLLGIAEYRCIDINGRGDALIHDFNQPLLHVPKQYDLVTNHGTTEHVFNQLECFNTIHRLCKPSGLMLHALPHQMYYDHCFFLYQWPFFEALAAQNRYRILKVLINPCSKPASWLDVSPAQLYPLTKNLKFPPDPGAIMCVLLQKETDEDFKLPWQGCYISDAPTGYLAGPASMSSSQVFEELLKADAEQDLARVVSLYEANTALLASLIEASFFRCLEKTALAYLEMGQLLSAEILVRSHNHRQFVISDKNSLSAHYLAMDPIKRAQELLASKHPYADLDGKPYMLVWIDENCDALVLPSETLSGISCLFLGDPQSNKQLDLLERYSQKRPDQECFFMASQDLTPEEIACCIARASLVVVHPASVPRYKQSLLFSLFLNKVIISSQTRPIQ